MNDAPATVKHPPLPDASVLEDWKVRNSSQRFEEDAAMRYLARTEDQLGNNLKKVVDVALGHAEASPKV